MKRVKKVDTSTMERGGPAWRRELGKNVSGMRKNLGLSQLQLASRLCWPVSTLVKLESGELTPSEGQERDIALWVGRGERVVNCVYCAEAASYRCTSCKDPLCSTCAWLNIQSEVFCGNHQCRYEQEAFFDERER